MAVWKARVADGVRVYFKVVRLGVLVTGLPAGNFSVRIINPVDTAFTALTVFQATQQAGVYYVDIPSAFLTTHGAGHYGLSIGVHKPAPQPVDDEILLPVEVTVLDLDDLAAPGDAMALTGAERIAISDTLLARDMGPIEAFASVQSLCSAILKLTSRFNSQTGRTYRTDGSTVHMTQVPVTNPAALPIVELGKGA